MSTTASIDAAIIPSMTVRELRLFLRPHQIEGRSAAEAASALVRDMLSGLLEPEPE